jgi:hypothetical protein
MKGGIAIVNATNASYTISSVSAANEGTYSVRITNMNNSVTSSVATLTIASGSQVLFIARTDLNPADRAITNILGSQGFIVIVASDSTLTTNLIENKAFVVISSSIDGSKVSSWYNIPLPIVAYGSEVMRYLGLSSATVGTLTNQTSIKIIDSAHPLAAGLSGVTQVYQSAQNLDWGVAGGGGVAIAVATNASSYEMPVVIGYEKGAYRSLVPYPYNARRVGLFMGENSAAALNTAGINLFKAAVNWALSAPVTNATVGISRQPVNLTIPEGTPAIFSVNATGAPPYRFQWFRNGTSVANNFDRFFTVTNVMPSDNGAQFYVVFKGRATSQVATLTVAPPLPIVITQQPANRVVDLTGSATFSVGITGSAPYYQWYHNTTPISGANSSNYTVTGITSSDLGGYYVTITNRLGTIVTSSTALLSVFPSDFTSITWSNSWRFYTNDTDLGGSWMTKCGL